MGEQSDAGPTLEFGGACGLQAEGGFQKDTCFRRRFFFFFAFIKVTNPFGEDMHNAKTD